MSGNTSVERLARIEEICRGMAADISAMKEEQKTDRAAHQVTRDELNAFKNKGAGLLIAAGLFGTAFGTLIAARLVAWFMALMGTFK